MIAGSTRCSKTSNAVNNSNPVFTIGNESLGKVIVAVFIVPIEIKSTVRHDAVAWGYARAASARGVDIVQNCEATGFRIEDGQILGVETSRGFIKTRKVAMAVAGIPASANPSSTRTPMSTGRLGDSGAIRPSTAAAITETVMTSRRPRTSDSELIGMTATASANVPADIARLDTAGLA